MRQVSDIGMLAGTSSVFGNLNQFSSRLLEYETNALTLSNVIMRICCTYRAHRIAHVAVAVSGLLLESRAVVFRTRTQVAYKAF